MKIPALALGAVAMLVSASGVMDRVQRLVSADQDPESSAQK